jgi:hypothetical protein
MNERLCGPERHVEKLRVSRLPHSAPFNSLVESRSSKVENFFDAGGMDICRPIPGPYNPRDDTDEPGVRDVDSEMAGN